MVKIYCWFSFLKYKYSSYDKFSKSRVSILLAGSPFIFMAFFKAANNTKDIINNIIKEVNNKIPKYKYIYDVKITTEPLIKTTTQKIKRHEEYIKTTK